jgi:heat shock gene repressor HrcA
MMLDERKRRILQAIVEDYVASAEPVGSRALSKNHGLGVSAATIRNEMSDLEEMGFLAQPHTSAGRIPSAQGYRFYVDQLLPKQKVSNQEIAFIENWYDERVNRIEEAFQETAKLISKMTRNLTIVVNQKTPSFRYLQFLPYEDDRAILVLVADNGVLENRMMQIPEGLKFEELQRMAEVINRQLAGQAFSALPAQVLQEIQQSVIQDPMLFEASMRELQRIFQKEQEQKFYLGGTSQLMEQPEFRGDMERVRELLGLLEEERELSELLRQESDGNLLVTIGRENHSSTIQDCSIVQGTYQLGGQIVGRIAVIGPTRMEYQRVVSVMEFMQKHMESMLRKYMG